MIIELDHHSGVPIYRQLMEQVRRQIMGGQLPEGEKLVSVRELARLLKVNPMTVSKAYTLLEMEGILERRRGVGLFVAGLKKGHKRKTKSVIVRGMLKKAALTAIQMDMTQEELQEMIEDIYKNYNSSKRSRK
jgi:GntR family transcriptional regulator